ncbi:uncharacterized protein TNIN_456171 [Trichonephila inaurata madagascariensis]|uniref:Uncharacterized protein n=1 Tax=Trichonephila inaurata madagascariensis TaxID=2747483 RepID=A0A8X6X104_9ARAC|nr:uncharacterized protein TNIN_456171 [Trichonephila inaurata madagascariensis]
MGKLKGEMPSGNFSSKKETDILVAPCQGWADPCEFCDKRFGKWVESNEENIPKIPTKPGIFIVGLKSKNSTEVVDIIIDEHDIQKQAYDCIDRVYERVADKKSKITKSVVLFRWMTFKQKTDKDVISLCAHWYNNGVLPKYLNSWPGLNLLQQTDSLMFSDELQKWCYPKKDAFWRKPKSMPPKVVEVVKSCNWTGPCEVCDAYFGKWKSLEDVCVNEKAPDTLGIYIIALSYGKVRELVDICFHWENIKFNIKQSIENYYKRDRNWTLGRYKHLRDKDPVFQVRWMEMKDTVSNENCCFLYAHWLNAAPNPLMSSLPGEKILEKNERFLVRIPDKKWCYEIEFYKQFKISKSKIKKNIMNELEEDIHYFRISDKE